MALTNSLDLPDGFEAPAFSLPGVDGKIWSLADFSDRRALVVIFMCNHCPYVIAVRDRINALAKEFVERKIAVVGINSNDAAKYPDDSFESMKKIAREQGYVFPYLHDESQAVARAYQAVCTPDIYGFLRQGETFRLKYHGRLDDNWKDPSQVRCQELRDGMLTLLAGGRLWESPKSSMGCSIKWK